MFIPEKYHYGFYIIFACVISSFYPCLAETKYNISCHIIFVRQYYVSILKLPWTNYLFRKVIIDQ